MQMMDEYLLSRDELDTICSELRLNDISVCVLMRLCTCFECVHV